MKNKMYKGMVLLLLTLWASGCKTESKKQGTEDSTPAEAIGMTKVTGNYVTEAYDRRNEGYDWVAVIVDQAESDQLKISVRSRADKKKPTCTYDTKAYKVDPNTYETVVSGQTILFRFEEGAVTIMPENEEGENALYFHCSGGATFAGTYSQIEGPLDQDQIDQTQFIKVLNLQDVGFNVSSIKEDGATQLSIFTFGLPHEFDETMGIGNQVVTDAEVGDLNSDGSPELVVFTSTAGPDPKAYVHAFSVNNNQSMSMVYFQPTEDNDTINQGYQGHDEFALVEHSLVQRFPIFENGESSGTIRQIRYSLEEGEALRRFVVNGQTEYDR